MGTQIFWLIGGRKILPTIPKPASTHRLMVSDQAQAPESKYAVNGV